MTSISHLIIDEIHRQRMVTAKFDGHGYIYTWAGSAAEQLEALVEEHYVHKPTPAQLQGSAHAIIKDLRDCDRLSDLSHRALIEEAHSLGLGDNLVVMELCNRLLPGWEK